MEESGSGWRTEVEMWEAFLIYSVRRDNTDWGLGSSLVASCSHSFYFTSGDVHQGRTQGLTFYFHHIIISKTKILKEFGDLLSLSGTTPASSHWLENIIITSGHIIKSYPGNVSSLSWQRERETMRWWQNRHVVQRGGEGRWVGDVWALLWKRGWKTTTKLGVEPLQSNHFD